MATSSRLSKPKRSAEDLPRHRGMRWMRLWMVIFAYLTWASIRSDVFVSGRCCTEALRIPKVWVWDGGRTGDEDLKQAMILTSRLKSANSPNKIFKILEAEMDTQIFDEIHASSAYHSLAVFRKKGSLKWKNEAQLAQDRPLAKALATKIQGMMEEGRFAPRTAANLLWSVAQLPQDFRSSEGFVAALVELISQQTQGMKAQELSSSLWACARLQVECGSNIGGPVWIDNKLFYPLVNIQKTIERSTMLLIGKSTISTGPCSIATCEFTRGYIPLSG